MPKPIYLEPAKSIINTMGGVASVAEITGRDPSRVYRWMYPKSRGGTDGTIPQPEAAKLLKHAQAHSIELDPGVFFGVAA